MALVHIAHLQVLEIPSNFLSVEIWMEVFMNACASTIIPSNLKYPRKSGTNSKKINERYHEPTSFKYAIMHTIFLIENILLAFCSWQTMNSQNQFSVFYPHWSLGLFFLALAFNYGYYLNHTWPLEAEACFKKKFYWPRVTKSSKSQTLEETRQEERTKLEGTIGTFIFHKKSNWS